MCMCACVYIHFKIFIFSNIVYIEAIIFLWNLAYY